jgi:hypothetical protein
MNLNGTRQCPVVGCCEHNNELLGAIKGGEYLGQLNDYQLLIKAPAP